MAWRERSSVDVHREVAVDGEGVAGKHVAFFGANEVHETTAGSETIRLVVPEAADLEESPEDVLEALAHASERLGVGNSHSEVMIVAAPTGSVEWGANGIQYGERDAWVRADARLDVAGSVWLHEYVHTRQRFARSNLDRASGWLVEAQAEYYASLLTYERGDLDYLTFRRSLGEGRDSPTPRASSRTPAPGRTRSPTTSRARWSTAQSTASYASRATANRPWRTSSGHRTSARRPRSRTGSRTSSTAAGATFASSPKRTRGRRRPRHLEPVRARRRVRPADAGDGVRARRGRGGRDRGPPRDDRRRRSPDARRGRDGHVPGRSRQSRRSRWALPGDRPGRRRYRGRGDRPPRLGEATIERLSWTPESAGRYALHVGDDPFVVDVVDPADLTVTALEASPDQVERGEPITVTATVENEQSRVGRTTVEIRTVDGVVAEETVTLGPGESTTVETTLSFEDRGRHEIGAGDKRVTVTVESGIESRVSEGGVRAGIRRRCGDRRRRSGARSRTAFSVGRPRVHLHPPVGIQRA
ncbi:CARDB domain-containing protein [Saliphagus sp. GCM10025308]